MQCKEVEYQQFFLYINGVTSIKSDIINDNIELVVKISRAFRSDEKHAVNLLDIIEAGNKGLHDAIDSYTLASSERFPQFAAPLIIGSILIRLRLNFLELNSTKNQ